ncbi:hypothetical protein FDP41_006803 [Naegleria fowleri]|uniref:Uncharacterized protein n=1 Tax=Naegleria fowleri TaxID=5763 RepID=A0A6A5B6M1_NAEFO|nr:uncharacterized protein FDP41_006803 [Naegleria fowleri]KAF0974193.1 hypothetical protein FDP41_006803 [Naegleria fowleri]CAG4714448.1 unnamed protein product [Naegleria fowleri]
MIRSATKALRLFPSSTTAKRYFSSSRASFLQYKHVDTEYNNANTPFDFTPESYEEIKKILAKYPAKHKQSGILPLLHLAQRQNKGWIPLAAINKIAEICEVSPKNVFECVSFYTMYNTSPVGRYQIQVCVTTPCMITGSDDILAALEDHLGIKLGETTPDKMFTLSEMECMGCCTNAPMIAISDYSSPETFKYDYFEDLTVQRAIEIVEMLKRGEYPKVGPQNGRRYADPLGGQKTLLFEDGDLPKPYCRNLDEQPPQQQATPQQK